MGSGKPADYSAGKGVPPGNGNIVMLYAANAENITIEGPGTVDGQGHLFFTGKGDNTGPAEIAPRDTSTGRTCWSFTAVRICASATYF